MDRANKPLKKAGPQAPLQAPAGSPTCPAVETGAAWREKKPVWDRQRCFRCGLCWLSCPDAAVVAVDEGYYDSAPERCKGCGICAAACINDAITMAPEQAKA